MVSKLVLFQTQTHVLMLQTEEKDAYQNGSSKVRAFTEVIHCSSKFLGVCNIFCMVETSECI